jgi:hypothetical protein
MVHQALRFVSQSAVLPLLLEGHEDESLPPLMRGRVYCDFRREPAYFESLFDLVLSIYWVSFDDPTIIDLRESVREMSRDHARYKAL